MFGRMLVNNVRLDFFGNIELGSHFRIGHRGAHFVLANQPFAERTADRESRHHTERCGCHRHHRAARNTVKLLEVRPECCRRAQTTHHRDGTGEQPVMKINAHELGNRYTEHILKHGEHSHGNQKAQQKLAALPNQLEAGHHADRGKESEHQHRLQSGVEHLSHDAAAFKHREQKRKRHASYHWARHRQAFQYGNNVLEPHAKVISTDRKRQSLHHIDMHHKHVCCIYRQLTVPFVFLIDVPVLRPSNR